MVTVWTTSTATSGPGCWPPSGSGRPCGGWTSIRPPRSWISISSKPSSPHTGWSPSPEAGDLLGTIPHHARIAEAVHRVGALLWVDAALAAHVASSGCPRRCVVVCSPPTSSARPRPRCAGRRPPPPGRAPARQAAALQRLRTGALRARHPPYEQLAGTTAAPWTTWRPLGDGAAAATYHSRRPSPGWRERVRAAGPTRGGAEGAGRHEIFTADPRADVSTVLFDLPGHTADEVSLGPQRAAGVTAPAGAFYAIEASRHLGLGDHGAVPSARLAPYTDAGDMERLLHRPPHPALRPDPRRTPTRRSHRVPAIPRAGDQRVSPAAASSCRSSSTARAGLAPAFSGPGRMPRLPLRRSRPGPGRRGSGPSSSGCR